MLLIVRRYYIQVYWITLNLAIVGGCIIIKVYSHPDKAISRVIRFINCYNFSF